MLIIRNSCLFIRGLGFGSLGFVGAVGGRGRSVGGAFIRGFGTWGSVVRVRCLVFFVCRIRSILLLYTWYVKEVSTGRTVGRRFRKGGGFKIYVERSFVLGFFDFV